MVLPDQVEFSLKKVDKHAPFIKATKPEKKAGANVRKFCVPWIAIVGYKYVNTRHKTVPFLFPVLDRKGICTH
jgi:hypothetical protein